VDCALALAKQGHPIQSVCLALGVARSNVCERLTRPEDWHDKRKQTNRNPEADALLVEAIRGVIAESPMYCYRSVARQINGARDELVDPESQSGAFATALTSAGFSVQRLVIAEAAHFWVSDPFEREPHSFGAMTATPLLRFLDASL